MTTGVSYTWRTGAAGAYLRRVGYRIEDHRERLGISQRDLAKRIGWNQKSVSGWERGLVMPRVDAQLALASAFGVDPDVLFSFRAVRGERGYVPSTTPIPEEIRASTRLPSRSWRG